MKKNLITAALFLSGIAGAQKISSSRWTDLFSYNNVLAIRDAGDGRLIAATENGIFYYSPTTGEVTKLSKANGLHEVKISAFDYNPQTKTGLVGYQNGSMDVITENGIYYIVDIPIATGYSGSKKINHISISGNQAAVSVGYGVSVFKLDRREFGDTAFFSNNGVYQAAAESVIVGNTIYSATPAGLKKHELNVTFPLYSEWQTVVPGITNLASVGENIAYSDNSKVWINGAEAGNFTDIKDITFSGKYLIVAQSGQAGNTVSVLDGSSTIETKSYDKKILNTAFYNGKLYAGSRYDGLVDHEGKDYKPEGPYSNVSYKINLKDDKIWVSTGARTNRYNQAQPNPDHLGFYFFDGTDWIYPSFFKTTDTTFNVMDAEPNPSDYQEVFVANYSMRSGQGFYKFIYDRNGKDFSLKKFYPTDTSPALNRPVGFTFDDKGNLFASMGFYGSAASSALWYYDRAADQFLPKDLVKIASAQKPMYYDGLIWLPMPRMNILSAIDTNGTPGNFNDDKIYEVTTDYGLPGGGNGVISFTIDRSGDGWIGCDLGLRVLSNASASIKKNPATEAVIVTQNGIAEELFKDSAVLQIDVDSGNQKWVSVEGGGVFYLSPNGQNTLLHFTKENSPLPDNIVTDIKVDPQNGKVYFVTYYGIVVYQGDTSNVSENFGDVLVYPNPVVTSKYSGNVHIKGLSDKANIRIVDVAGNLVHQAVARGGVYEWDLKNRGKRVASGIYFVLMTNADGTSKATTKIAVVN